MGLTVETRLRASQLGPRSWTRSWQPRPSGSRSGASALRSYCCPATVSSLSCLSSSVALPSPPGPPPTTSCERAEVKWLRPCQCRFPAVLGPLLRSLEAWGFYTHVHVGSFLFVLASCFCLSSRLFRSVSVAGPRATAPHKHTPPPSAPPQKLSIHLRVRRPWNHQETESDDRGITRELIPPSTGKPREPDWRRPITEM